MEKNKISLVDHISLSLNGAWQFIKLNPKAIDHFDTSSDGFWKSFWAIALVAPIFLIGLKFSPTLPPEQGPTISLAAYIIEYTLRLPLLALAMILFTKFLKIDAYYSNMIIAFNWLWVLANYIIFPITIMNSLGILPKEIGGLALFAAAIYLMVYVTWFMIRQSLRISGWLAVGVLVFQGMFTLSIMLIIIRIF